MLLLISMLSTYSVCFISLVCVLLIRVHHLQVFLTSSTLFDLKHIDHTVSLSQCFSTLLELKLCQDALPNEPSRRPGVSLLPWSGDTHPGSP